MERARTNHSVKISLKRNGLRLSKIGPVRPFSEFCFVHLDINLSILKCFFDLFNFVYEVNIINEKIGRAHV